MRWSNGLDRFAKLYVHYGGLADATDEVPGDRDVRAQYGSGYRASTPNRTKEP